MSEDRILSAADVARIGAALYRGVEYNGRPAWQSWLAEGLGVDAATIRRWLMDDGVSSRSVPRPIAMLLQAADGISHQLQMWGQPRGTPIVERMALLALHSE